MKKFILLSTIVTLSLNVSAKVNFDEAIELNLPSGVAHPVLSPDGTKLLYSSDDHTGLNLLDMSTRKTSVIDTDAGAGYCPAFTPDSRAVIYRTARLEDGLTMRDVRQYSLADNATKTLSGFNRTTDRALSLTGAKDYALADYRTITLVKNGVSKSISPIADAHSYLWASLSPDGKRLLFVEPFEGVFIADADGKNPVKIADKGDFPAWVDDTTVTYIVSHDDGYVILDSSLMVYDLNDKTTEKLTDETILVGESTAAAGYVIYSTLDGKLFMLTKSNR